MASGQAPSTFVEFSRYVVSPGQHSYLILDRAQNTRSIGFVAGYAQMDGSIAARQFDVPVVTRTSGFIFKDKTVSPGPLVVQLRFGSQGLIDSQFLQRGPSDVDISQAGKIQGGGKEIRLSRERHDSGNGVITNSLAAQARASNTVETSVPPLRKLIN